jgi:3-oxoacyl-[acyl-carrier-protein] synthase II
VLEELSLAKARGARIHAEIIGFGSSGDASHIAAPDEDGDGARRAMIEGLRDAAIDKEQVEYINAHGTSTPLGDAAEVRAVKALFGDHAPRVPFSSVKSMLGHLIQAAGAVELITCVQSIRTGHVPPTMNLKNQDPQCDLDYVPNASRDLGAQGGVDVCLSNSFGFGGQNDTLCVRRWAGR